MECPASNRSNRGIKFYIALAVSILIANNGCSEYITTIWDNSRTIRRGVFYIVALSLCNGVLCKQLVVICSNHLHNSTPLCARIVFGDIERCRLIDQSPCSRSKRNPTLCLLGDNNLTLYVGFVSDIDTLSPTFEIEGVVFIGNDCIVLHLVDGVLGKERIVANFHHFNHCTSRAISGILGNIEFHTLSHQTTSCIGRGNGYPTLCLFGNNNLTLNSGLVVENHIATLGRNTESVVLVGNEDLFQRLRHREFYLLIGTTKPKRCLSVIVCNIGRKRNLLTIFVGFTTFYRGSTPIACARNLPLVVAIHNNIHTATIGANGYRLFVKTKEDILGNIFIWFVIGIDIVAPALFLATHRTQHRKGRKNGKEFFHGI